MDFCPRFSMVAIARERYATSGGQFRQDGTFQRGTERIPGGRVMFTRLRCGQWDCEYCAAKNQLRWRGFLARKLPEISQDWQLLTLTASARTRKQRASYENLQHGIDKLFKRIRRVFGEISYVRTFERHPTSEALHAHFIISGLSPFVAVGCWRNLQPGYLAIMERSYRAGIWSLQSYLKNSAYECGMGYMADARPLAGIKAAMYVTKYLTKELQGIEIKGLRHVATSRDIGSGQGESEYRWQVRSHVTAADFHNGEHVFDLQAGEVLDADYWQENNVYPPEMI